MLLPQSCKYPNLSEATDGVSGQLCGDKEHPFSGITSSGRVWRKVPESDAQSLALPNTRYKIPLIINSLLDLNKIWLDVCSYEKDHNMYSSLQSIHEPLDLRNSSY